MRAEPAFAGEFWVSKTLGLSAGGSEGSFLCSLSSRFSGRGGGGGEPPQGVAGEVGGHPLRRWDRKSVVLGKSVDLGGRRVIKKKNGKQGRGREVRAHAA